MPGTGPRRSCYSDTGMLAMPLSKVTEILRKYSRKRGGLCRNDSVETRVAIAEVLVCEKPDNYRGNSRVHGRERRDRERLRGVTSRGASLEVA